MKTLVADAAEAEQETQDPLPPYLFLSTPNTQDFKPKKAPTVLRSRLVKLDMRFLPVPDENFIAEPDHEIPLILNLFPATEFSVLVYKIERNRSGSYSWYGKLENVPMSQVVLVVKGEAVYGNISKPGLTYQIRHVADGLHFVYEIDPSRFPPDGEPVGPSMKTNPSSLPDEDKMSENGDKTMSSFLAKNKYPTSSSSDLGFGYDSMGDLFMSDKVDKPDAFSASGGTDSSSTTGSDDGSVIELLVVYTAAAREAEGGASAMESLIDLAESETNAAFSNSGLTLVVNVVARQEIVFSEDSFSFSGTLSSAQNGSIPDLHDLRNTHGADLVVVLVKGDNSLCGIAYLMTEVSSSFEAFGYSVTQTNCATGNFTFGHEIGHNMAARHDRANDDTDGRPFDFNHGYVDSANNFKTIMGTGSNTRIQNFSNPNVLFGGAVTGVAEGNALAADNRKTFQNTALTVSNFRESIGNQQVASIAKNSAYRVMSPYWQSDDSSYSFIAVTHPSLSGVASQVGVLVQAVRKNGTLFGSSRTFTIDRGVTRRIFIVRSDHPSINSSNLIDVELIAGISGFRHGFVDISPVASNPEVSVQGFRDVTMLNYWGAIVIESNTTGFAMEFIGDMHDSAATSSMDDSVPVSGVN